MRYSMPYNIMVSHKKGKEGGLGRLAVFWLETSWSSHLPLIKQVTLFNSAHKFSCFYSSFTLSHPAGSQGWVSKQLVVLRCLPGLTHKINQISNIQPFCCAVWWCVSRYWGFMHTCDMTKPVSVLQPDVCRPNFSIARYRCAFYDKTNTSEQWKECGSGLGARWTTYPGSTQLSP